ncbi:cupredoxin domain-containing protein [Microvirga flavescens]|uniref:cupredoxin domain-containing protein n=1 Tax=Microvirga flavescens TaxID=2249811 RepID=UPI000DD9E73F|nr:cupredoxin family copper-binding protein [Microvirga flavescens]
MTDGSRHLYRVLLVAIFALAGPVSASAEVIQVKVSGFAFNPAQVVAHVGDTIQWVNGDFLAHTATARDGKWDVSLPAGKSGALVVKKAGAIDYYCRYHPNMVGRIDVVRGKAR